MRFTEFSIGTPVIEIRKYEKKIPKSNMYFFVFLENLHAESKQKNFKVSFQLIDKKEILFSEKTGFQFESR